MRNNTNNTTSYNEVARSKRTRLLAVMLLIIMMVFIVVALAAMMSNDGNVAEKNTAYAAESKTETTTEAPLTSSKEENSAFVCTCHKTCDGELENWFEKDGCKIFVVCDTQCPNYRELMERYPSILVFNTKIENNSFSGTIQVGDIGEGANLEINVQSIVDTLKDFDFSTSSEALIVGDYANIKNSVLGKENDGNQMDSVDENQDCDVVQDNENGPVIDSQESAGGNANANNNKSPSASATEKQQNSQQATVTKKPTNTKPSTTTKPNETKPSETKPSKTKPSETKPSETKPSETKPSETKPSETKPSETKPSETKPSETKPSETKPSETKPARVSPVVTFASNNTTQGCYFTVTGLEKGDVVKCNYSYELIDSDASSMYARVQLTLNGGDTVLVTVVDANGNIVAESYVTMYATNQ